MKFMQEIKQKYSYGIGDRMGMHKFNKYEKGIFLAVLWKYESIWKEGSREVT